MRARVAGTAILFAAIVIASCDSARVGVRTYNGIRIRTPVLKPQVTLERVDGSPYNIEQETSDRVTLLYFGYTHCPDVCPTQLMSVARAFRILGADTTSRMRLLFVTLDPTRDTGALLQSWLHGFHPEFVPLRASSQAVDYELRRLHLASPDEPSGGVPNPAHASAIVVFGRDGMSHFLYSASTNAEAWAYDLRQLLRDSTP